ncbi:MAG: hypothetical protein MUF54_08945 [Polyangiaceae bacterium]|jgi:hypothetical protein|nr:hypothetical protein [Polyangiaceae bacterium]
MISNHRVLFASLSLALSSHLAFGCSDDRPSDAAGAGGGVADASTGSDGLDAGQAGSGQGGQGTGGQGGEQESPCRLAATVYVDDLVRRCDYPSSPPLLLTVEAQTRACEERTRLPGMKDMASQIQCLRALANMSCSQLSGWWRVRSGISACVGTLVDGEPCVVHEQCSTGHCRKAQIEWTVGGGKSQGLAACGTCGRPSAHHDPCGPLFDDCGAGFHCVGGICQNNAEENASCLETPCVDETYCNKAKICQRVAGEGQSCDDDLGCEYTSYCDGGICRVFRPLGDDCDSDFVCDSDVCSGSKCVAPRVGKHGDDCGEEFEVCDGSVCTLTDVSTGTVQCTVPLEQGSACFMDEDCGAHALCDAGTCNAFSKIVCR